MGIFHSIHSLNWENRQTYLIWAYDGFSPPPPLAPCISTVVGQSNVYYLLTSMYLQCLLFTFFYFIFMFLEAQCLWYSFFYFTFMFLDLQCLLCASYSLLSFFFLFCTKVNSLNVFNLLLTTTTKLFISLQTKFMLQIIVPLDSLF